MRENRLRMNSEPMDQEPNPYAPPHSEEMEADESRGWRIIPGAVYARQGTTLPKVDLLTGVHVEPLRRRPLGATPWSGLLGNRIWAYSEDTFANRFQQFSKGLERVLFVAILIVFLFRRFIPVPWILEAIWAGVILLAILWIHWISRKKLTIQSSFKPGWLRISPIHPDAVAYLRKLKAEPGKSIEWPPR